MTVSRIDEKNTNYERTCRRESVLGRELAQAVSKTQLPEDEAKAKAWHRDLQAARKTLKAPSDKWG